MNPNNAIATIAESVASIGKSQCLHCGRALRGASAGAPPIGHFCCEGCRQVHHYLTSSGLDRYYQLASALDERPPSQADRSPLPREIGPAPFASTESERGSCYFVPDLTCAACLWLVEHALTKGEDAPASWVRIDLDTKMVRVEGVAPFEESVPAILRRLAQLGYRALPPALARSDAFRTKEARRRLVDLGIAGATFGNVMLFATAVYFGGAWGIDTDLERFFSLLSLGLATVSLTTAGRTFFRNAWGSLRGRSLHIDLPIAVALSLSYGVSIVSIVRGRGGVYFDSVTGLIFLLLVARHVNETLQGRARRLAAAGAALLPTSGAHLSFGDEILVMAGDIMPADGVVTGGESEAHEAALTGEPKPVVKHVGDKVFAGTSNLLGTLRIRVTASGQDCYVARLARLVDEAALRRAPFVSAAESWLRWFVGGIFVAAGLAAAVWSQRNPSRIVEVVCATLIVSCPCALALATPLTMAGALRRAWKHGVIVKSSAAIEALASVDTIVLDKTGTITSGVVQVLGHKGTVQPSELAVIALAAARSRHPVAQAVAEHLKREIADVATSRYVVDVVMEQAGRGLTARVATPMGDLRVLVGSAAHAGVESASRSGIAYAVVETDAGTRSVHEFVLHDPLAADAAPTIATWLANGLEIHVASGDAAGPVARIGSSLRLPTEHLHAAMMPEDKERLVRGLVASGKKVMMVGDGINDAAALAAATVGVAVAGGVDLALGSADAFLSRAGLGPIEELRGFARHTLTSLRLILALNVSYNIAAVALAISGVLHPFLAAAIMPLASLTILGLSALRQGEHLWKSSTSSCPLPSPSPAPHSRPTFGPSRPGNSTT